MLYSILKHCRNFFVHGSAQAGKYAIEGGELVLPFIIPGQYFLVQGSVLNDGVWQYGRDTLTDEVFTGTITPLAIPQDFLKLVQDIEAWQTKNGDASPYTSESFGGYSYTRAAGASGAGATWQDAFRTRLNPWRKL